MSELVSAGIDVARSDPSPFNTVEGHSPSSAGPLADTRASITPKDRTDEERFLLKLGFSKPFLAAMRRRAEANGTTMEAELLASGAVKEDAYFGALARVLGLDFMGEIDATLIADSEFLDSQFMRPSILRLNMPHRMPLTLIVPSAQTVMQQMRFSTVPSG